MVPLRPYLAAFTVGLVVVGVAISLGLFLLSGNPNPTPPAVPSASQSITGPTAGSPAPPDTDTAQNRPPTFDVVRITPNGDAVMAGRAAPGENVIILSDDTPIGEVFADDKGEWVYVAPKPLSPESRNLYLATRNADGTLRRSETQVALSASEGDQRAPLAVAVDGATQQIRILQRPETTGAPLSLAIDTADVSPAGMLTVAGRAPSGETVRLYLDNSLIGEAIADEAGTWSITPPETAAAGTHVLRVDQVDGSGSVVARSEAALDTPVAVAEAPAAPATAARESPSSEEAAPTTETAASSVASSTGLGDDERHVTVTPGSNLWQIASRAYGEGFRYVIIYDANRNQIRDPDLIYPGQVLTVPRPTERQPEN
ncbi:MAG: LysM peptidoglycan-binding domain-containing protein [Magnetospiraceae bacterium]